jgi:hypothetical protein
MGCDEMEHAVVISPSHALIYRADVVEHVFAATLLRLGLQHQAGIDLMFLSLLFPPYPIPRKQRLIPRSISSRPWTDLELDALSLWKVLWKTGTRQD